MVVMRMVMWMVVVVARADPEHVPIRVADVHLPHAPWLIGGWPGDVEALPDAGVVHVVHIRHPHRHPRPVVIAAAALRSLTQEDLMASATDRPEGGRVAEAPQPPPTKPLKPLETGVKTGHVQNRGD